MMGNCYNSCVLISKKNAKMTSYQIQIEKDENGVFVGEVLGLPACYTQANSIPELFDRLMEVSE